MWPSAASLQGLSCSTVMLGYVSAQFVLWAMHDALQQLMFTQPGFAPFGTTMALFLQSTCVLGSLLERTAGALVPSKEPAAAPAAKAAKPRSSETAAQGGGGRSSSSSVAEPGTAPSAAASRWREMALGVVGSYLFLGLMIALSAGLANGSLAFVSQPVKVLFKSSKVLPVMFFRAILGNSGANSWADYGYAIMLGLGLALFSASDAANTSSRGSDTAHQLIGMAMLLGSVCCDAMAPNLQERLLRKLGQPRPAVVLNTNALSALLTAAVWFPTGEAAAVHEWFGTHRSALHILLLQSVVGYLGVLAYLGCIRHAGSKATVLVTTARKMCTIFLSYSIFSDSGVFTARHFLGLLMAVGGMTGSALREAVQMKSDAAAAATAAGATAAGGAGASTAGGDTSSPSGGGTSGGGAGAAGEGGDSAAASGAGVGGDVESAQPSSGGVMRRLLGGGASSQAVAGAPMRRSTGSSSTLAGEAV